MERFIGAAEAARMAGAKKPRFVSDLFAQGRLDTDRCPVVAGCRMIPESYLPTIRAELAKKGWLTLEAQVAGVGDAK
jgi:hypothetical protein